MDDDDDYLNDYSTPLSAVTATRTIYVRLIDALSY